MINIRQLPNRIEVYFWSTAVSLMSEYTFLQRLIRKAYAIRNTSLNGISWKKALIFALVGLLVGFVYGIIGI